ncbi:MAG: hypothetical protein KKC39_08065 [Candidatus Omnitrophica bacterium]|nr:hypothetical protein [Candidatus Omnitrophota bacterium]MBU4468673.1 hypothetical protein [Candidatus Omnitrophota bacterium]
MHKQEIPIIHIIGLPGAGKTTLARRLSKVFKEINSIEEMLSDEQKR